MNTSLLFQNPAEFDSSLLAVFAVDISTDPKTQAPLLLTTSQPLLAAVAPWLSEFKATLGETLLLHRPSGLAADRVVVIGLGKAGLGKASALTADALRKAAGTAVRFAKPRTLRDVALVSPVFPHSVFPGPTPALPAGLVTRSLAEGALLADFDIDFYRSDRKDQSVPTVTILSAETNPDFQHWSQIGLAQGIAYGQSQNFARTLVNEPGNILTPTELGRRAAAMADEVGLACEVHGLDKLLELKMGAFAAVTQGSVEPPALIVLTYDPQDHGQPAPAEGTPVFGLVGKGITFDTGGISLKPGDNMDKMKYDMAGAAAMLGAMRAIALLKPSVRVISVICSCENMPDGRAYKPGDVLTAMSGKTIEVLNTDAEGRLVLADGLHYAQQLGATHLINAATLTGAIGVALGLLNTGLFSNDDHATQRFLDILPATGEKYWRMPCTDDYKDTIKSQIADIMNTGGSRYGGATSAAMFLKEFAGSTPWIHLDIAGTAWSDEAKPWQSKGPTGVAVRSIAEWVRSYSK